MKGAAYLRVSTELQGTEDQRRAIEDFASRNGIEIIGWFQDPDVSGAVPAFEREGFREMLNYMARGNVKAIVVYALDRLGRSFTDIFRTLNELDKYGITVFSVRDSFLQTLDQSIRKLVLAVLAWASEYEVKLIRERVRLAMRREEVQTKLNLIRKVSKISSESRKLIVSLYSQGWSLRRIAKALNLTLYSVRKVLVEEGVIEPNGCPRCSHKLFWDDIDNTYKCRNCGYRKL